MYKNILFPVDVTEDSSWNVALPVALEYARNFKSTLHILTVVPDLGMKIVSQYFPAGVQNKMVEEVTSALYAFTENNIPSDVKFRHIVVKGAVYEGIIDTAEEINADLILMAAHRPELKDYLLGPNAAKVVRHSNKSVLVVRDGN